MKNLNLRGKITVYILVMVLALIVISGMVNYSSFKKELVKSTQEILAKNLDSLHGMVDTWVKEKEMLVLVSAENLRNTLGDRKAAKNDLQVYKIDEDTSVLYIGYSDKAMVMGDDSQPLILT